MATDNRSRDKKEIARQILAHLVEKPDRQDTIEGIVLWWLLECRIKNEELLVKEIIQELVAQEFVQEKRTGDSRSLYRINRKKKEEIEKLLK
ncbi:MAG: hypothetical protein A2010_14210 [Nitrospirae bacterium GWD2_57_9]|nr:MAG: hypothetical protein A2010_14210 [Nitrospirae bacterium GWD2_57_9]OGW49338.1 MAG: hypothetical protein A2078_01020 [Nitrospirae bacterium GWC2_57_9]